MENDHETDKSDEGRPQGCRELYKMHHVYLLRMAS